MDDGQRLAAVKRAGRRQTPASGSRCRPVGGGWRAEGAQDVFAARGAGWRRARCSPVEVIHLRDGDDTGLDHWLKETAATVIAIDRTLRRSNGGRRRTAGGRRPAGA